MNGVRIYAISSDVAEQSHGKRRDPVWHSSIRRVVHYLGVLSVIVIPVNFYPGPCQAYATPQKSCSKLFKLFARWAPKLQGLIIIKLGQDLSEHCLGLFHQRFEPPVVLPIFSTAHFKA